MAKSVDASLLSFPTRDSIVPLMEMAFLDVLSLVAILSTIGLFLCGIPICQNIASKGNTDGISAAPFLGGTIGCFFWLRYGFLKADGTVITVNTIGFVLEAAYLLFYWYYCRGRHTINRQLTALFAISGGMLFYVSANAPSAFDATLNNLGLMCVVFNVLNFAAPLAGLADVVRTRSTENLPLPLCAAGLLVSAQWFLYGVLVDDNYIKFPNVVGIGLSLVQLSLFFVYPRQRAHAT